MTFEEYNAAERQNSTATVATLYTLLQPILGFPLSPSQWAQVLGVLFQYVYDFRKVSATVAREFYDDARLEHLADVVNLDDYRSGVVDLNPELDRHPIFLAEYKPEWFEEAMEPARERFSRQDATTTDLAQVISLATKEVQNGGRRTLQRAVQTDKEAIGFARVEGGGESCAFCLMLISRGPVYKGSPANAGLRAASNTEAVQIWRRFEETGNEDELMLLMDRWHENCDCRVVPVFDEFEWPGRDAYLAAEDLWAKVTGPYRGGKRGGEKLKVFRRYLHDGYSNTYDRLAA